MPVTTTSEEWNALADRAEAATGLDRELDALIWLHLPKLVAEWGVPCPGRSAAIAQKLAGSVFIRRYTDSVDDALTLVPEGWCWSAGILTSETATRAWVENREGTFIGEGLCRNPKKRCLSARARTPALALLAACCRAQADLAVQS